MQLNQKWFHSPHFKNSDEVAVLEITNGISLMQSNSVRDRTLIEWKIFYKSNRICINCILYSGDVPDI